MFLTTILQSTKGIDLIQMALYTMHTYSFIAYSSLATYFCSLHKHLCSIYNYLPNMLLRHNYTILSAQTNYIIDKL